MIETFLVKSLHSTSSMGDLEKYVLQCDPVAILAIMSSYINFPSLITLRALDTFTYFLACPDSFLDSHTLIFTDCRSEMS